MAIEKDNSDAMYNLGNYYKMVEENYNLMEKYYLMAIDRECKLPIENLERYYKDTNNTMGLINLYLKINNKTKLSQLLMGDSITNKIKKYYDCIENTRYNAIKKKVL